MNQDRIALVVLAAGCIASMTACNRSHTLSDVQLTQLLHVERVAATEPQAPLDPAAVNCLRAWSGDVELTATLPPVVTGEAAKTMCRRRLDGWIADATRNPDKLKFEEVSAPPSVRRAVALLAEHRAATAAMSMPSANDRPPPGLVANAPANPAGVTPGAPVDMTTAVAGVGELDSLCQKAKQAAATSETTQPVARYATYCDKRIEQLRARISMIQHSNNVQQAQMITNNVQRTLEMARQLEAQSNGAPKSQ